MAMPQHNPHGQAPPLGRYPPGQVCPPDRYVPQAGTPPGQVQPPSRTTPGQVPPGRYPLGRYAPGQVHPPTMANERAVRILLECILVSQACVKNSVHREGGRPQSMLGCTPPPHREDTTPLLFCR